MNEKISILLKNDLEITKHTLDLFERFEELKQINANLRKQVETMSSITKLLILEFQKLTKSPIQDPHLNNTIIVKTYNKSLSPNTVKKYNEFIKRMEKWFIEPLILQEKKVVVHHIENYVKEKNLSEGMLKLFLCSYKYYLECNNETDLNDISNLIKKKNEIQKTKVMTKKKQKLQKIEIAEDVMKKVEMFKCDDLKWNLLAKIYHHQGVIRSNEILNLKWKDIYKINNSHYDIYIDPKYTKRQKNLKEKVLCIPCDCIDLKLHEQNKEDYIFTNEEKQPYKDTSGLNRKIEKIFKQSHKVMRASKVSCVLNTSNDEMIDDLVFIHGTTRNTMSDYYQSYIKQLSAEQES